MASQVQITGGAFQDVIGTPLANGYLTLVLSQDAQVNSQEISAGIEIKVPLDENGDVQTSPAVNIWPNDQLSPANTFYTVSAYTSEGQLVWGPNAQQVLSTPSPYDIGAWTPGQTNTLNPGGNITGLIEAGTNVTITGTGTTNSPYSISSTGGGGGGVTSFNTRTGAVTLESSDVDTALGFTPANSATAITALTGDVTASGPGSAAATLATVNADPGTVGSTSAVPVITSDAKGRITATSTAALGTMAMQNAGSIAITGGSITGTPIGSSSTGQASGGFSSIVVGDQLTSSCVVANSTLLEGENSSGAPTWTLTNQTGAAKVTSLEVGSSQSITGVQGTTGSSLAAANGTFTSGNLTTTDSAGNIVDSGIAKPSAAFGTMAEQNASAVAITGGAINGTTIGATTPAAGTFSSVSVSGTHSSSSYAGHFSDTTQYQLVAQTTNASGFAVVRLMDNNGVSMQFGAGGSGAVDLYKTWYVYSEYSGVTLFALKDGGGLAMGTYAAAGNNAPLGGAIFPGNVGIGTASPGVALDVSGTVRATEFATTQTPTASTTASDHSIPIVVNGTTYYMRLSTTP